MRVVAHAEIFVSGHSLPDMSKAKPYLASRTMLHVISSRIVPTA